MHSKDKEKETHTGFTIVEVILVLAISGLLLAGLLANVATSIYRHRYENTTESFAEYLRSVYSAVINVQNSRTDGASNFKSCSLPGQATRGTVTESTNSTTGTAGRTECAIYGKLITFNEDGAEKTSIIREYDVIGDAVNSLHDAYDIEHPVLQALKSVNADVVALKGSGSSCKLSPAGNMNVYTPSWGMIVTAPSNGTTYSGAILIVRSPATSKVHTFSFSGSLNIFSSLGATAACTKDGARGVHNSKTTLYDKLVNFESKDIDLCIKSDDAFSLGHVRNVRILKDGGNVSAVKLVDMDKPSSEGGNRCQ